MTMVSVHYLRCCHLNFRYGAWPMILTIHLNHLISLAKWLSVRLRTKWFWVRVQLQSLKLQIWHLLRARSSLTFRQLWSVDSLWNACVTWQEHTVRNAVKCKGKGAFKVNEGDKYKVQRWKNFVTLFRNGN